MKKNYKKWFRLSLGLLVLVLLLIAIMMWILDPYIHFHKPFSFISYRLYNERYINDGISRNFEYDTLVTGTSMSQNFKTSEVDEVFNVQSVKEPFSGAHYYELSQNIERAIERNSNLKTVIWSLDYNCLRREFDYSTYSDYPDYLYDDNVINDINYIYNKEILYHGLLPNLLLTLSGKESTTMDEYASWDKETGLEYILQTYDRTNLFDQRTENIDKLTEEEILMVKDNININIVELANKYPDIAFYIFYTPYSICHWDYLKQLNLMEVQFQAEEIATSLMLECPNIKLYNFFDQYEVVTDLNNYRDKEHYASNINTQILYWINDDIGLLTKDNYVERLEEEKEFYRNYDYESIYK